MGKKIGIKEVIKENYCIGCGACAFTAPSSFTIAFNQYGQFEAKMLNDNFDETLLNQVCPFADDAPNEDDLGKSLFPQNSYVNNLGFIYNTYAGYVVEGHYRMDGSSGGFGSWLCVELLRNNKVDGIIHLVNAKSDKLLFEYAVSTTSDQITANAKSKYYPVKLDEILDFITHNEGRFAIVGIPCMIKTIRLISTKNPVVQERIKYTIGLVCGHIKSTAFAEMLGWQLGVRPRELKTIDFRTKLKGYGSNQYGITVTTLQNGEEQKLVSKPVNEMFGTNWGLGYFKSKACDFCDDVLAETADITIGDAWLPEYVNDYQGTNVVVIRNPEFDKLIQDAYNKQKLYLEKLAAERVIESQSSGINHRRKGLQYRLYLNEKNGQPSPRKRVQASNNFDRKFKKIQELRIKLRDESNKQFYLAKQADDLNVFINHMKSINEDYAKLYKKTILQRIYNKIKRTFS